MKRICVLFFLVCLYLELFAQDTIELAPVEIRGLRAGKTAPFAKTNINKNEIEKINVGQDLPFVLNFTPSVVVNSDAGTGVGYTGIRIRGSDATRINVTLNGIPFNDAESGGTFFVDMPDFASSVNSIQIQRGVGTSTNGAGSFGATINLSTHELNKDRYVELQNTFGSFSTIKNTVKAGTGLINDRFTADLRLSRITSDGYVDRASSNLYSYYFSTALFASRSNLRFTTFSGKEKTYQAWYGVSEKDLQTNRTANSAGMEKPGSPYENETDNYTQTHYQLFFDHKLSSKLLFNTGLFYVKGKGYYEQYKANRRYSDYNLQNVIRGNDTLLKTDLIRQLWLDNDFYGSIFSLQYLHNNTGVTIGGAVTNYKGDHFGEVVWAKEGLFGNTRWYNTPAEKKDFNIYGKLEQKLTQGLQLFTDLQLRYVNHTLNGFRDNPELFVSSKYTFFNPKAGISYFKNNWLAFASYSIGNKEPNRDDFEATINEQPKPEHLKDLEIGFEKKTSTYSFGATGYLMKYKDQLVLTGKINDVGAYTRTNINDSYRAGIELQGSKKISSYIQLAGNLALSRNRIKNFTEFIDDYDNGTQKRNQYEETDISFSPGVVGAFTIMMLPVKNIEVALQSKYVGKQYLDNTSNEQRKLNAFYTQDLNLSYRFQKKGLKNVYISGRINNIFNTLYEPNGYTFSYYYNNELTTENYYFPMAGRNWFVTVNIRL